MARCRRLPFGRSSKLLARRRASRPCAVLVDDGDSRWTELASSALRQLRFALTHTELPLCLLCDGHVVGSSFQEARMRPWRRTRAVKPAPEERVQSKMSNTALGIAVGPGVGLSLGLAIGGAKGIPIGLAIGAGIGVAVGAALDEAARRRHD